MSSACPSIFACSIRENPGLLSGRNSNSLIIFWRLRFCMTLEVILVNLLFRRIDRYTYVCGSTCTFNTLCSINKMAS